jgi:hypothetical protein
MNTRHVVTAIFALALTLASPACGPSAQPGFGGDDAGGGGSDGGLGGDDSGFGGGVEAGGPTFGSTCKGASTTLTGTVYAPNGTDPLPNIYVYAAAKVNPFPPGNYCNKCNAPLDDWFAHTQSSTDGTFTLDLGGVPDGSQISFVVNVGRFRKVTQLPVKACGANTAPKAATTLPGTSADGDIPKIAVSTGNQDHLDQILGVLGITEFDCYEGRKTTTSMPTCTPVDTIANLLAKTAAKTIDDYHLLFVSCAPNAYATFGTQAMATNTSSFVTAGGRLFTTDMSYDYVAQAFPAAITWMGPGGSPQPVGGANVGTAGTYQGNVDDASLKAWLGNFGITSPVSLQGFLNPWSVQASLPKTSTQIVDGTVTTTGGSSDVPLTTQFDVSSCGRVIYSSYHTAGGTVMPGNLLPQERILEYLMFEVATCVMPTPQ